MAHADSGKALKEVSQHTIGVLKSNGRVWIAEAGQSDFSAALIRNLQEQLPDTDLKDRIHIVQHADWNEQVHDAGRPGLCQKRSILSQDSGRKHGGQRHAGFPQG